MVEKNKVIPKEKSDNFRLCSKSVFLTFSRCGLELETIKNQLQNKVKEKDPTNFITHYVACKERHENISIINETPYHVHGFFEFSKKVDTKDPLFFDIKGYDISKKKESIFHPNVQSAKSRKNVIKYVLKNQSRSDLDNLSGENSPTLIISPELKLYVDKNMELQNYQKTVISLAKIGDVDAAMRIFEDMNPGAYLRNHAQVKQSLTSLSQAQNVSLTKYKLTDFKLTPAMLDVIQKSKKSERMLYVKGASGTGKTQFLLTLIKGEYRLNPLVVSNLDGIRFFKAEVHTAILFNDFNWNELKYEREKLIHLLDVESACTISVKHSSLYIPENVARFAASNLLLEDYLGEMANLTEIARRVCYLDIGDTMLYDRSE